MQLAAAFISVILIWSTTPLAIKWSALGAGFSFAVLSRMTVSTLLCLLLLALFRVRLPLHRKAVLTYLVSGTSMCGTLLLAYWSSQYVSSGTISVLFGLTPLISGMAAMFWLKEESVTPHKLAAMLLGLAGLALVFTDGNGVARGTTLGLIALFSAVVAQALGLVWMKKLGADSPPLATTFGSLLVALPLFFLAWFVTDRHLPATLPMRTVSAILYLAVVGSLLGFMLYFYLIKNMETGKIALINLVSPVLALLLGNALNHEAVLLHVWLGAACIISGLAFHHFGGRLFPAPRKSEQDLP